MKKLDVRIYLVAILVLAMVLTFLISCTPTKEDPLLLITKNLTTRMECFEIEITQVANMYEQGDLTYNELSLFRERARDSITQFNLEHYFINQQFKLIIQ